jgi:hypothetical protein
MHATPASPALLPTWGNSRPLALCATVQWCTPLRVHLQVYVVHAAAPAMRSAWALQTPPGHVIYTAASILQSNCTAC